MTSIQRKPIPSWLIIVFCMGVGILFAFIISWRSSIGRPPTKMYFQPPSKATAILGVANIGYERLYIRAADGNIYYFGGSWLPDEAPKRFDDKECSPSAIQVFEASAGKIADCRQYEEVHLPGFPAPLTSYAITENGDLWELYTPPWITPFAITLLIILALFGILVGVMIVTVRWLIIKIKDGKLYTPRVLTVLVLIGLFWVVVILEWKQIIIPLIYFLFDY